MEQGTKEWLDLRRTKIGASDASAILGINPWKTPFQLWEEKVLGKDQEQNSAMARGSAYEEEARQLFQEMTGIAMMPKVILSDENPWQMASLDGISLCGTIFMEIKVPNKQTHEMARDGIIHNYYDSQMQHAYGTRKELKRGIYFSYDPKNKEGIPVEVSKNEDFIIDLKIKEEKFFEYIISKTPPPFCDRDYINKTDNKTWELHAQRWIEAHYALKKAELDEEVARKTILELTEGRNSRCSKMKVTRSFCKGTVDYKTVPELIGVDLEPYRKPPCEKWRLSAITKDEV